MLCEANSGMFRGGTGAKSVEISAGCGEKDPMDSGKVDPVGASRIRNPPGDIQGRQAASASILCALFHV